MNIQKSRQTSIMALVLAAMALYASLSGIIKEKLYNDVFLSGAISKKLIFGSRAQDMISIPAAIVLLLLSVKCLKTPDKKVFITMLGLVWYFFYGYGLYTIQGQYTSIYIIYLAIFGLSIYLLIWGFSSFEHGSIRNFKLPKPLKAAIAGFLIIILVVLVPVWFVRISKDIANHLPGDTYAVFILDLCVVFPAFGIIAYQLLRNKPPGNILAGLALFKILTLCLSVAFGEWYVSYYGGYPADIMMIVIFSGLTLLSSLLFMGYLRYLQES